MEGLDEKLKGLAADNAVGSVASAAASALSSALSSSSSSPAAVVGGAQPSAVKDMAGDVLKAVMSGSSGGDALKMNVQRAVVGEVEKEFKNFLTTKGVNSDLLASVSLSDLLKKTSQLKNLNDDQVWGGLKKVMSEKAGLNPEVSDMVINVMKENGVSFEDLKGILGDKGLREDTFKDALKFLNPKAARLIAENPGCLRIFDLFKEKNNLSMEDVMSVVAECQQAKEAWSAPEPSDSDGDFSENYQRRAVGGKRDGSDSEEDEGDDSDSDEDEGDDSDSEEDEGDDDEGDEGEDDEGDEDEGEDDNEDEGNEDDGDNDDNEAQDNNEASENDDKKADRFFYSSDSDY